MQPATRFFLLTLGIMVAVGAPVVWSHRMFDGGLPVELLALGVFSPGIAALTLTFRSEGRSGAGELLSRLLIWRLPLSLYLIAFALPLVLNGVAVAAVAVVGDTVPGIPGSLPPEQQVGWLLFPLLFLVPSAAEELGWRGYALPHLMTRRSGLQASLVIGLVWAVWHLPLALIPDSPQADLPFGWYVVNVVALSAIFTWLYNTSQQSLLLVTLFHASIQASNVLIPNSGVPGRLYETTVVLYVLTAALVAWRPGLDGRRSVRRHVA